MDDGVAGWLDGEEFQAKVLAYGKARGHESAYIFK